MMTAPETYIDNLKDKSYEELLKVRDELIVDILYFENHLEEQMANEIYICPSPSLVYQWNLETLGKLLKLISKKFDEKYEQDEEDE